MKRFILFWLIAALAYVLVKGQKLLDRLEWELAIGIEKRRRKRRNAKEYKE